MEKPTAISIFEQAGSRPSVSMWTAEGRLGPRRRATYCSGGASEFYESFWVEDAETYREYAWQDGGHADAADVTSLFS